MDEQVSGGSIPEVPPTSAFLDVPGPVHYWEWPGAAGVPMVCLHAIGGSGLHWRGVAPGLVHLGRVLAVDQIGFGQTPRAGRSAGLEQGQPMLTRFLRAAHARPAVLIGHSMGGFVALQQAARDPGSVRALVLSSPLLPPSRDGRSDRAAVALFIAHRIRMRALAARRSLARPTSLEGIIARALRGGAADPERIDPAVIQDSIDRTRTTGLRETAESFAQAARSSFAEIVRDHEFRGLLDRVECPVLLVHGGQDRTIPVSFAERAARDHPAWRLEVFPELGHLLQLEDPERWIGVVAPWIEQHLGTPSGATLPSAAPAH